MKIKFVIILFIGFFSGNGFAAEEPKSRFEELYIWKMSDELSLTVQEEKKFTDIVKELNKKKANLSADLALYLNKMTKAKSESDKTAAFAQYKKTLQDLNKVSEDEIDRMKSLLGLNRIVKYLEVKQDMTNRLKSALANPDQAPKKPLPAPKVIEE